jgi:hypothetical protein
MSLGIGAYADTSRLIDDNVRAFKGMRSEVEGLNKKLQQGAQEGQTLDDLKTIGQEFALNQTKKMINKYGSKVYNARIPFAEDATFADLDKEAGAKLDSVLDRAFSAGNNIPPPLTKNTGAQENLVNRLKFSGDGEVDELMVKNLYARNLNASGIPVRTQTLPQSVDSVNIAKRSDGAVEMSEMGESKITPIEDLVGGGVEDAGKVAGDVGADIAEAGVENLGKDLAEEGALQATAGAFASTGIGAPVAAVVEAGADVFALFEGVKSIGDLINRDVLHNATPIANAPQQVVPTQPKTIAQKGYLITPSFDTYDMPHNTASYGW